MDTLSSQCQYIMCIKRCCHCFKPRIKLKIFFQKCQWRFMLGLYTMICDNGGLLSVLDFVTYKVLISNTTLTSFIPPQVRKMNPKLCHI